MGVGDREGLAEDKRQEEMDPGSLDPLLLFLFASFVCSYSMEE